MTTALMIMSMPFIIASIVDAANKVKWLIPAAILLLIAFY